MWETDSPFDREEEVVINNLAGELRLTIEEWLKEVRRGWERQQGQIEDILKSIGDPDLHASGKYDEQLHSCERLGMWAAALINPLPPLGVASEIRPEALQTTDTGERLKLLLGAYEQSLVFMRRRKSSTTWFNPKTLLLVVFLALSAVSALRPDLFPPFLEYYSSFSTFVYFTILVLARVL